ncbi:MAG: choice-of-anchor Q domain-containing protein [Lysobacterales bacterium]
MKNVLKAIALSGIALTNMPVHAAVITVTTLQDSLAGPSCSLRAAVQAASTDAVVGGCNAGEPGLDRIDLGPGVHRLTLTGANEDAGLTGDLDVGGDLQIVGSGAGTTFIEWDGAPNDRLLDVAAGATLEVSDLTLRRGLVAGRGGLVRVDGTATLRDCGLFEGTADFGGAVGLGGEANLTVERCEIASNLANGGGIGAGLSSTLILRGSQVHDNVSRAQGGGAVLGSFAALTIEDTEIADNRADDSRWGGGGLLLQGGSLTLRGSTLAGNSASDVLGNGSAVHPALDESGGAALSLRGAQVDIENSTISGNSADETLLGAGGILAVYSDVRLAHSTLVGNQSQRSLLPAVGATLARWDNDRPAAELHLTHSLVSGSGQQCAAAGAITGVGNRIDDASCGAGAGSLGAVTGLDPLLADNGGQTRTHRLLPGSNARDAGPASCLGTSGQPLTVDQRGVNRPQFGVCDLGAVEIAPAASSTTITAATPDPSQVNEPVTVNIAVNGDGSAPADGQITVLASSGESCSDATSSSGSGSTVLFSCNLVFASVGPRTLTASFGSSSTHEDSVSAPEPHAVITALTVGPGSLPNGTFGMPYSTMLSASGAGSSTPYSFVVSTGLLPPGLMLASNGALTGTPTAAGGPFVFSVTATDSSSAGVGGPFSGTRQYSITIARADQAPLTAIANPSTIPFDGSSSLSSSGGSGSGAVSFAVSSGGGVCMIAGSSLTGIGVGNCTVTATKAADANHNPATATVEVSVLPAANLQISVDDGTGFALPGSFVEYEILVANAGPLAVTGARVQDPVPTGLTTVLWTCTPVQGANCPTASGSGGIDELVDLPVNAVLRFVYSATVTAALGETITHTATIDVPAGTIETDASDNSATDVNVVAADGLLADGFEDPGAGVSVLVGGR